MSDRPTSIQNGDPIPHPIDYAALAARIEVCIGRVDVAIRESKAARQAAEKVANDQFELRTGLPPSWRRRLVLVALAAAIGALAGTAERALASVIGQDSQLHSH